MGVINGEMIILSFSSDLAALLQISRTSSDWIVPCAVYISLDSRCLADKNTTTLATEILASKSFTPFGFPIS